MMHVRWLAVFLGLVVLTTVADARRVALVIGNSAYNHVPQLANPRNDAAAIGEALQQVGFDVQLRNDLGFDDLRRSLRDFSGKAAGAEMALVYFAGHGIEVDKHNFLVPVDARLRTDRDVQFEAVPLDFVMSAVEGAKGLRLVLLDACRNNPFAAQMKMTNATRSIGRGLSRIEPSAGTLVSYAAKEGTTADDGEDGNSPYTRALVSNLTSPGLEINFLFRKVRDDVLKATGGRQEPFTYGSLPSKRIYLRAPDGTAADDRNDQAEPPHVPPQSSLDRDVWETIADSQSAAVLKAYIQKFPDSIYAELAKAKLKEIRTSALQQQGGGSRQPAGDAQDRGLPDGSWAVVVGSYPRDQRWKADDRVNWLRRRDIQAVAVNTNDYGNLRDGLWAVIVGPTTRTAANVQLRRVKRYVGDAYVKRAY